MNTEQYSDKMRDLICERIACGESVRSICLDETMPSRRSIYGWLREKPDFRDAYTLAKQESAEVWADEIIDIADNEALQPLIVDGKKVFDADGKPILVADAPSVNHARLRVDARKWAAAKLRPKKYGAQLNLDGELNINLSRSDALKRARDRVASR